LNKLNTSIKKINSNSKIKSEQEDDEFYYEDEDFNRRLNGTASQASSAMTSNLIIKQTNLVNSIKLKATEPKNDDLEFHNNFDEEDDLDDDDEDLDDIEDDECSSSSSSSTPSPGSSSSLLTSSGTSSGYSTPTKTKSNKTDLLTKTNLASNEFDLSVLNEKLTKKQTNKKNKMQSQQTSSMSSLSSISGQQVSATTLTTTTGSKRNSRNNLMGYSSDNPAEKRAFHILSERQRRNDLKKLFETLRINIPALCDKQKASKLTILKAAVDHLSEVTNKKEKLCSIFDKEKVKNTKLLQQLKALQQQQQYPSGQQLTTLVVH